MRSLSLFLLTPLAACTGTAPAAPPSDVPYSACLPDALALHVDQTANKSLGERMLRETGKSTIRWVAPGTVVTMDVREDRLTVYVDAGGKVERVSCS